MQTSHIRSYTMHEGGPASILEVSIVLVFVGFIALVRALGREVLDEGVVPRALCEQVVKRSIVPLSISMCGCV